jgi:nucleotide-binding universal stress UspA family protein
MFDRVLVPLDGSDLSEGILGVTAQIAKALKSTVTVAYVAPPEMAGLASVPLVRMPGGKEISAQDYLASVVKRLQEQGVKAEAAVIAGYPALEIAMTAQEQKYDLIAMATHGRSGMGRWVYGSTTDKVLHTVTTPLLLRRPKDGKDPGAKEQIRHIVVPLDGSELGESVLAQAADLAKTMGIPVRLTQIVPTGAIAFAGLDPYAYDPKVFEIMTQGATEYLEAKTKALQQQGLHASYRVLQGYAPGRIIDLAEQTEGSLIVMSTHGRSGMGRWVLGSVADRVLRASFRPVLVIRPKVPQQ